MQQQTCIVGYALNTKKMRPSEQSPADALRGCEPWCGGGLADILGDNTGAAIDGVQFQQWDPKVPVAKQPKFHVIVHKLTEDLLSSEATDKIIALEEYLAANPETVVVDKLSAVRCVVSRALTCQALERIQSRRTSPSSISSFKLSQPAFFLFDTRIDADEPSPASLSGSAADAPAMPRQDGVPRENRCKALADRLLARMREQGLSFPIICKPVQGCGTPASHHMIVVVSEDGLSFLLKKEQHWLVQQYHNHDSCFYKVYVIDTDIMVFMRPSLPNLESSVGIAGNRIEEGKGEAELEGEDEGHDENAEAGRQLDIRSVEFDSRFAYPTIDDFLSRGHSGTTQNKHNQYISATSRLVSGQDIAFERGAKGSIDAFGGFPEIMLQKLRGAALDIREEFGLSLFGFDVIAPTHAPFGGVRCANGKTRLMSTTEQGDIVIDESQAQRGVGRVEDEGELLVVDVNFFPSYKEVTDFPRRFRTYLRRVSGLPPI